jgi:hypothetical protein
MLAKIRRFFMTDEIGGIPVGEESPIQKIDGQAKEATCLHETERVAWRRGVLPGGKYIKTCPLCGAMVPVEFSEWQTISDK